MSIACRAIARLPVTGMQQFFLENADADGRDNFNLPVLLRLNGPFDRGVLERALDRLVERHEALRTTFQRVGGRFEQTVWDRGGWPLEHVDLRADPQELDAQVREFVLTPVPLLDAPMVAARVFELAPSEQVVALRVHHLVVDGWSCEILLKELTQVYLDAAAGRSASLPPVSVPFRDYLALERATPEPADVAFWRGQFDGAEASTAARFGEAPTESDRACSLPLAPIPHATVQGLDRVAAAVRVPRATAMLAVALAAVLEDGDRELKAIVIRANRDRAILRDVVGFVAAYLPVVVPVGENITFGELVSRTHRAWLSSLAHAIPFREISNAAGIGTYPGYPVADLSFNYFMARPSSAPSQRRQGDARPLIEPVRLPLADLRPTVRVGRPLSRWQLEVGESAEGGACGLLMTLEQSARSPAFASLPARFAATLEGAVQDPDRPLADAR
jgi:hypothetical protein